jgi:hypothetical protein
MSNSFRSNAGVRLAIHDQNRFIYPGEDGFDVAPGQQTNIALYKSTNNKLPAPYSDCLNNFNFMKNRNNNGIFKQMIETFNITNYDQKFCLKLCQQDYIRRACNCLYNKLPTDIETLKIIFARKETQLNIPEDFANGTICLYNQLQCASNASINFHKSEYLRKCYQKCPTECNKIDFVHQISISKYPTEW